MYKIAVLVSGRGSNLRAILNTISNNISVAGIVSDKIDCPAFAIADQFNIPKFSVAEKSKSGYLDYEELLRIFSEFGIDLIVLAGFLKKIPDKVIDEYEGRIINIHPALLPSFGGKGMYGINVHRAVFNRSCQVSGATIHFVDKIYDNGKIIAQETVDISDVQSPEEIAERVLKVEHKILPKVIKKFAENKVIVKGNRVIIQN
ncbi:Phosphoribosylglycinamide formyltransferase [hydrothermal vent metagenome]|uniref:phosphoribosylglycinamide formyltransferase 1 n=1 Tax=hydrothermal vent metagenome TaxID=652676 RepID=A0A3B1BX84_9ZZZZ